MRGVCQVLRAGSDWQLASALASQSLPRVMRHFLSGDRPTCAQCRTSPQREGSESARSTAGEEPSLPRSFPSHMKLAAEPSVTRKMCLAIRHWPSRHLRKRQLPSPGCSVRKNGVVIAKSGISPHIYSERFLDESID